VPLTIPNGNHVQRKKIFATIFIILTFIILGTSIAAFDSSKAFVYASYVKGVGVGIYWDQACTNRTLLLNWGLIEAGSNTTLTVYVRNEINSAASLWLGASNWNPPAAFDFMSLNWNYSGQVVNVDQVIPLELTLIVYPTIAGITDFSFNTIITLSEV
jgi:hypothetical protein